MVINLSGGWAPAQSALRASGLKVEYRDLDGYDRPFAEALLTESDPDLVDISCSIFGWGDSLRLAAFCLEYYQNQTVELHATDGGQRGYL